MDVKEVSFRGKPFKLCCLLDSPGQVGPHPSWYMYEDEAGIRDSQWQIGEGDLVLDVGAAYGSYALAAVVSGASHVYAWSPQRSSMPESDPKDAVLLRATCEANGWADRVTIIEEGVFNADGWLNVRTQQLTAENPGESNDVIRVRTLDSWADETFGDSWPTGKVWLKVDVESAEVEVLRGAEKVIRTLRPTVLVENHLFMRPSIAGEVRAVMESYGYREAWTAPYHAISHSLYVPA